MHSTTPNLFNGNEIGVCIYLLTPATIYMVIIVDKSDRTIPRWIFTIRLLHQIIVQCYNTFCHYIAKLDYDAMQRLTQNKVA